jgi:WD40 repeat protein/beta-lactamase regulating signal transducer with metallopeptidase domain
MSTLLAFGLTNAVCAAVLALLALAVSRATRRPALAHALWLLVLLKLVTPPLFGPSLPVLPADEGAPPNATVAVLNELVARSQQPEPAGQLEGPPTTVSWPQPPPQVETPVNVVTDVSASTSTTHQTTIRLEHFSAPAPEQTAGLEEMANLLGLVWLGGALVVFGRAGLHAFRFHRLLRYGKPAPAGLQEELAGLAGRMGLRRCPQLWLIPGALPPLVWGWGGTVRVFFPSGLLERLREDERLSLLAHELGHIRRGDHRVRWLEVLVGGLYWWYPLVWLAQRYLQQREEECCDALAVEQSSPRVYATAILETVDFLAEARPRLPALASGLSSARSLEERLTLLFTDRLSGRLAGLARLTLAGLALVLLPLFPQLSRAEKGSETSAARSEEEANGQPRDSVGGGTDRFPLAGHSFDLLDTENDVYSLDISRDGRRIAVGTGSWGRAGSLKVLNLADRRPVWEEEQPAGVAALRFLRGDNRLAWAGWDRLDLLRDFADWRKPFHPPSRVRGRMALSPDGRLLATAAGEQVKLWDTLTGQALGRLATEPIDYYCVKFSRDGRQLAVGGAGVSAPASGLVMVYDLSTHQQIARLRGHNRPVLNVDFAPGNGYLATASADHTVRLWEANAWTELFTFTGHTDAVEAVTFSSDSLLLATGGHDRTIRLWETRSGMQQAVLEGHPGAVRQLAFTPDDQYLVSGGARESVLLWDVRVRRRVATLSGQDVQPNRAHLLQLALSPDGQTLALARDDHTVHLHQAHSGKLLRALTGHRGGVTSLVWSPDGRLLASGSLDHTIRLWDPRTGQLLRTLTGHTNRVRTLAISPNGRTLASGGDDNMVRVWDTATGRPVRTFRGSHASVRAVAFSPDGTTLVSGGTDQAIHRWSLTRGNREDLWIESGTVVLALSFSPDGKWLASAGEDGAARIWLAADGSLSHTLHHHEARVLSLAWASGGQTLATAGLDRSIQLWDVDTGDLRASLKGHTDAVTGVAFAPDGRGVFSSSLDQTARFWPALPAASNSVVDQEPTRFTFFATNGLPESGVPFRLGLRPLPAGR